MKASINSNPDLTMITQKQSQALNFIAEYQKVHRSSPSYDEIKDHMGLKSKSGINRIVTALIARGFLTKVPGYHRALRVAGMPLNDTGELACADELYQAGFRDGFDAALNKIKSNAEDKLNHH